MSVPFGVLAWYALSPTALHSLGNHGGFSGARLWRVEAGGASYCLRALPPRDPSPEPLRRLAPALRARRPRAAVGGAGPATARGLGAARPRPPDTVVHRRTRPAPLPVRRLARSRPV